jgi:hypothetical protein
MSLVSWFSEVASPPSTAKAVRRRMLVNDCVVGVSAATMAFQAWMYWRMCQLLPHASASIWVKLLWTTPPSHTWILWLGPLVMVLNTGAIVLNLHIRRRWKKLLPQDSPRTRQVAELARIHELPSPVEKKGRDFLR